MRDKLEVWRSRYFIAVHYIRQWRLRHPESVDELPIPDELEQDFDVKQRFEWSRRSLKGLLLLFYGWLGTGEPGLELCHWATSLASHSGVRPSKWPMGCGVRPWAT